MLVIASTITVGVLYCEDDVTCSVEKKREAKDKFSKHM
jgi:hypothetical protein